MPRNLLSPFVCACVWSLPPKMASHHFRARYLCETARTRNIIERGWNAGDLVRERIVPRIAHFHVSRTFLSNVRSFHAWISGLVHSAFTYTLSGFERGWWTRSGEVGEMTRRLDTARNFYSQVASDSRWFRERNHVGVVPFDARVLIEKYLFKEEEEELEEFRSIVETWFQLDCLSTCCRYFCPESARI